MEAKERREQILDMLKTFSSPVSAAVLAKNFNVSRQVVVGDIALLRASGANISSTARGYICVTDDSGKDSFPYVGMLACRHDQDGLLSELYSVVDNGGCVIDVMIEHPIYGQLSGNLDIRSRFDADEFYGKVTSGDSRPLSALTNGIHLHRVGCRDEAAFRRIEETLLTLGILLQ